MSSLNPVIADRTLDGALPPLLDDAAHAVPVERAASRTRWLWVLGVVVVAAAGAIWYKGTTGAAAPGFRLEAVQRGSVTSSVTATGTLNAVMQIEVGTQVSGQISAIYADFNDHVKAGQLIARIDPTLLEQAVSDAEAGVERSQAALLRAEREYARSKELYDKKVLTESEFNDAEYARSVAQADAKSAQVSLDRARRNLAYTRIYAPIDGVVVERNVDVGQTVAASFSAPQLFLIAQDLSEMEILASVDESDIGEIRAGQAVKFTVQAYPDATFTGTVRQVRLQSTTTENVVNYTAVVQVANPTGKLLPGMTATVSFLTGSATDVLTVPNAALRYEPSAAVLAASDLAAEARAVLAGPGAEARPTLEPRQSAEPGPPFGGGSSAARSSSTARAEDHGTLWYVDAGGRLDAVRVAVGVSDGRRTEVSGSGLKEGMGVIVGTGTASSSSGDVSSPFQTARQSGPARPGF